MLLGLLLLPGMIACDAKDYPAVTTAGFMNPEIPQTPIKISASSTPFTPPTSLTPTITPSPTESPLALLTPTRHSPTPVSCTEETGRIEERQLESELLDDPLDYLVYLPPCYSKQLDLRYPVLYLIHGQTYTNRHWIDLGVTDLADRLISNREVAPFIMIFPYDRDHYKPPTTNLFGDAVLFELIPAIDRDFRTIPNRDHRAIGGISRGGNWAAHLGLQHPELFNAIGLHSTPIFSVDTNREIIEWIEAIPLEEFPRLFIDIGENDRWLSYTLIFEDLLNKANIPYEWYLYPGFHEDDYWKTHLEQYIRWYTSEW